MLEQSNTSILKLIELAKSSRQQSDFATTVNYYQQILSLQPQRADIYAELGNIYNLLNQSTLAISAYKEAIKLQPKQPAWVYQGLAQAFKREQKYSQAISAYEEAIRLQSEQPVWVFQGLAQASHQEQRYSKAIAAWQRAIELDTTPPRLDLPWLRR